MKNKLRLLIVPMLILSSFAGAQVITKDSVEVLRNEKEILKLAKTVNDNKLKLAELENRVAKRTSDIQVTAKDAQKAANANQEAAEKLSGDAQDKGKAKDARKAAKHAENSAGDAREAEEKLSDLNKDIEDLKNKIREDEQKIVSMTETHIKM